MPITKNSRRFLQLLLPVCLLLLSQNTIAQDYKRLTATIDSLDKLNLPQSALLATEKLDKLAQSQKNTPQHIKAILYRMRFQSFTEENAIVSIVNGLKRDIEQASFPEKPVLQSLLADVYWMYYQRNRYAVSQRSRLEKPGADFTQWDMATLNNEVDKQFQLSLRDTRKAQQTPVNVLDGVLAGYKLTRNLRPTLYDFLIQRALNYYLQDDATLTTPKPPFGLYDSRFFGDSRAFAVLDIPATDTTATLYKGIKYLQQATMFHLQRQDDEATADLDLKRLDFMYAHAVVEHKDQLYLDALAQIAGTFSDKPISADAIALQGKYYYNRDSLKLALAYFNKAAASFAGSYGALMASGYLATLQHQELSLTVEDVNVPDKPLLGLISYRNIKNVSLQLYKISATMFNRLAAIRYTAPAYSNAATIYPSDSVLAYFQTQKPVQVQSIKLPGITDYKKHSTEFKIDPLPIGIYVALLQDTLSANRGLIQLNTFKITHLGFVTGRRADNTLNIRVADRETGKPIAGVHVILAEHDENKITDSNGAVNLGSAGNNYSIKLTTRNDTLYTPTRYSYNPLLTNNEKAIRRTILFTDRNIYRPGQIVYYKGVELQTQDGKNTILPHQEVTLTVRSANSRQPLITIPAVTNDFGSFSGSFALPQNMLNGSVALSTGSNSYNSIMVEEYKRPGFQVAFQPVTASYRPNDTIVLKGNVAAFSGYGISQAKVVYRINRQMSLSDYRLYTKYRNLPLNFTEIAADTIKADNNGQFEIKFKASTGQVGDLKDFRFNFNISATVGDGIGETKTAFTMISTAVNNINMFASIPNRAFATDSARAVIIINNMNAITQRGSAKLSIYELKTPGVIFKSKLWARPDSYLLDSLTYRQNFPADVYNNENLSFTWPVIKKVADLTGESDGKQFITIDLSLMKNQPSGMYRIVVQGKTAQGDTSSVTNYINWVNEPAQPGAMADWVLPFPAKPGDAQNMAYYVGTGAKGQVLVEKYSGTQLLSSQLVDLHAGKQQIINVPVAADEKNVSVQFLIMNQNRVYSSYQRPVQKPLERLDIKFITFRNKLQPGEKEQWKLQVTGKNKTAAAAEMVAGMYDTALDEFSYGNNWNNWSNNSLAAFAYQLSFMAWESSAFVTGHVSGPYNYTPYFNGLVKQYEQLNLFGYNYYGGYNLGYRNSIAKQRELQLKMDTTQYAASNYNEIRIDEPVGNASSQLFAAPQFKTSSLQEVPINPGQQIMVRGTGSMNTVAYGQQAVSNDADPALAMGQLNPVITRRNFNETAFFYPQLHTDAKGQVLIDFTIPEALTRWRFRAYAYTKDLQNGYAEQTVVTQKQLSISANMPRFLRAGDTVTVSARLANLTATAIKGQVELQLFNGLTMQPVNLLLKPYGAIQSFDIAAANTRPVSFRMVVPVGLDALTYRLTARSGQFSDGEENTLPVLPNQLLVTESMPMMVRPAQTKLYTLNKLLNQHSSTLKSKTLTLEYTQNPAWYAVQALPGIINYQFDCPEQLFNSYYANSMANNLVSHLPVMKRVMEQWKAGSSTGLLSNLEKNPELKNILIEETPWLQAAQSETEQKKRIALLFDLNNAGCSLQLGIEKLQQKQLPDGGFSWFGGDRSDSYITSYILAGIGQLYHLNITDTKNIPLKNIADRAMHYLEMELLDNAKLLQQQNHYENRVLTAAEIHAYYTRSYFVSAPASKQLTALTNNYLKLAANQWAQKSIYEQGLIALTMLRNNKTDVAQAIIRSLNETAQHSDDMGMYWSKNQAGYYWYQAPVETQSLMIELFTEAGSQQAAVDEMKLWLLRNKQTSNWQTGRATAAACYALLMKGGDWVNDTGAAGVKINGQALDILKPGLKADAGTGFIKTTWTDAAVKPALAKVEIKNNGKVISWGSLYWQYLENIDKITPSQTDIHLQRKYFIQKEGSKGPMLVAVDATHQPQTGDLLKVVVYLKAGRDFEYVQLKDMRPAGTEPVDVLSAYKYQDGLHYYQVTKDAATNFFIDKINKGNYVFEYSLRVAQPGNYSTGISTVQCMYAPEFNAHAGGQRLVIKP